MWSKQRFVRLFRKSAVVVLVGNGNQIKGEQKVCAAALGQEGGRFGYGCVISDIKFTYSMELQTGEKNA